MGLAILTKCSKDVRKQWDGQRIRLSMPGLFTQLAPSIRTLVATPLNHHSFSPSDRYSLFLREGRLEVYIGLDLVGICKDPPRSILLATKAIGGRCLGLFHGTREISGLVEITVCLETQEDVADKRGEDYEQQRPRVKARSQNR